MKTLIPILLLAISAPSANGQGCSRTYEGAADEIDLVAMYFTSAEDSASRGAHVPAVDPDAPQELVTDSATCQAAVDIAIPILRSGWIYHWRAPSWPTPAKACGHSCFGITWPTVPSHWPGHRKETNAPACPTTALQHACSSIFHKLL